jgi:hypothetical protein
LARGDTALLLLTEEVTVFVELDVGVPGPEQDLATVEIPYILMPAGASPPGGETEDVICTLTVEHPL